MRTSRWIAMAVVMLMATNAIADPDEVYRCKREQGTVEVTFKPDTKLEDVITWAMGFTCRAFLYDPRILGRKVTIIAPERMSAADAYGVFLAALSTIGLTAVEANGALRIVDAQTAKHERVPLVHGAANLDDRDDLVRLVYHPDSATADTMMKAFAAMKSDAGEVAVVGNVVVITDFAGHVHDMVAMAKLVDVPGGSDGIYTIAVDHADARKLVDEVQQVLGMTAAGATAGAGPAMTGSGGAAGGAGNRSPELLAALPTKLVVDDRTNTIWVAGSQAAYDRVLALVRHVDIALEIESGQAIHVVPLRSAIAEDLALTLTQSLGQGAGSAAARPGGIAATPGATSSNPAALTTGATPDGAGTMLEGKVKVIADKPSNKLVVIASGHDFLAVRAMIRDLDVPRRQVFIDAQLLEVDLSNETDLGASAHGVVPGLGLVGGVEMPSLSSVNAGSTLAGASGLIGGIVGAPFANSTQLFGISIPTYAVLINALATDSNTNVLQVPSILALDNDEAKLKVGTNVPYKGGVTVTPTTGVTTSISREDLALELDIKPHITDDDVVLLEVKHEAKDLGATSADLGPSWTTRSFETKLLVHDQRSVAIGGLIEEREVRTITKVPLLGDIPILGNLFKYDSKVKKKSSLLIVLTPYIIRDQDDLERIRARKQREHDELTRSFSTFEHMKFEPGVDYAKKRGLLEEINRAELDIAEERAEREALPKASVVDTGAVPLDTSVSGR